MHVLITGAGGFVGRAVAARVSQSGAHSLSILTREPDRWQGPGSALPVTLDLAAPITFADRLAGVDAIIHLAARTSWGRESDESGFHAANCRFTEALAEAAASAGVRRFVFVSSLKVNGERSGARAMTAADAPAPQDAYGRSKRDAEEALFLVRARSNLEVAIVRPPLVVGPGAKGSLTALAKAIRLGIPLPLAAINDNRRSFLALADLSELLMLLLDHPLANGKTYLAQTGKPMSTAALVRSLSAAFGRKPPFLWVPRSVIALLGRIPALSPSVDRLTGDLEVDDQATRQELGWRPLPNLDQALAAFVAASTVATHPN